MTDMSKPHTAAAAARLRRGKYLVAIGKRDTTPLIAINDAHEAWGTELRAMRLSTLFLAHGDMTERQWRLIRDRMLGALQLEVRDRDLTIQWLLDQRAGGRRLYALKDALRTRSESPWPGYPWAPRSRS